MKRNPFGEDAAVSRERKNPFGGDAPEADPAKRISAAAGKIRRLKQQLGAEGLTLSATRELLDEVSAALDATARALGSGPSEQTGVEGAGPGSPESIE